MKIDDFNNALKYDLKLDEILYSNVFHKLLTQTQAK